MKQHMWWQDEIVYQIYPKSFYDSNNDGIGDLQGIIEKLDYLKNLGITMIWICPIFKSPMIDNGYDISDYLDIEAQFGSMEDLKILIKTAQQKQIKIILDLVINHSSDEHPWFQKALQDPNSKYRNYYIFKYSQQVPNNWRSVFGGSVWEKLPNEDTYYYHTFHKKQPDFNWENPELRSELYSIINQWLEIGIAGFRVDAITFIKKDLTFKNITPDGVDGLGKCTRVSRNQPGIEIFLNELNTHCFKKYNCVTIAEAPGVDYASIHKFIGKNGFFSMIFDFKYADLDVASGSEWFKPQAWTYATLFKLIKQSQLKIQKYGWAAPFIENHDQPRATSKYLTVNATNNDAIKSLGLMYFFLRGTTFIYQGQELGLLNFERQSIHEFNDISSIDQYTRAIQEGLSEQQALNVINCRSRDNSRTPIPWTNDKYGGFSPAPVNPWIKPNQYYPINNVTTQLQQQNSIFKFYQAMITLKKSTLHDVLCYGTIEFINHDNNNILIYRRYYEQQTCLIIINLTQQSYSIKLEHFINKVHLSTNQHFTITPHHIQLGEFTSIIATEDIIKE